MRPILFLMFLVGCASPAPDYFGALRHDLMIDGIRFVVYQKPHEAEVIRMGYLTRQQRDAVPALMYRAAELATGCQAVPNSLRTRLPGDTGEGRITLRCQTQGRHGVQLRKAAKRLPTFSGASA